jgi:hypothetical protein
MPGEFYDTLGEISSCAIELGDSLRDIQLALGSKTAYGFRIERNGNAILIYGTEGERTFPVEYNFRISNHLPVSDKEIQQHTDELGGVDVDIKQLRTTIRKQKLKKIDQEAIEDALESAKSEAEQIETEIQWLPHSDEESDLWDGFIVKTRLYPYTSDFGIQHYNETVKQVIGDGIPVASTIFDSLDVLGKEQAPELSEAEQSRYNRTYQ